MIWGYWDQQKMMCTGYHFLQVQHHECAAQQLLSLSDLQGQDHHFCRYEICSHFGQQNHVDYYLF
jgi:hypothetical protein